MRPVPALLAGGVLPAGQAGMCGPREAVVVGTIFARQLARVRTRERLVPDRPRAGACCADGEASRDRRVRGAGRAAGGDPGRRSHPVHHPLEFGGSFLGPRGVRVIRTPCLSSFQPCEVTKPPAGREACLASHFEIQRFSKRVVSGSTGRGQGTVFHVGNVSCCRVRDFFQDGATNLPGTAPGTDRGHRGQE